jgi:WD40 repeat protein
VRAVSYSRNGRQILSGSRDKTMRLWDLTSGKVLYVFRGHSDAVRAVAAAADGYTFLSAGRDTTILVWEQARK